MQTLQMPSSSIKRVLKRHLGRVIGTGPRLNDSDEIDGKGHREYVGGLWDAIGALQFRFMIDHGLDPPLGARPFEAQSRATGLEPKARS